MKIYTSRFGEIDIEEEKIIKFTQGLLGFFDIKRYIILDHPNRADVPFKWLQAIDEPDLAFVITDPLLFCPDYNPEIDEQDLRDLHIADVSECGIIVIVTIPYEAPDKMTSNLMGPVIVNLRTREAKQIVLRGEEYPLHYPLFQSKPALDRKEATKVSEKKPIRILQLK